MEPPSDLCIPAIMLNAVVFPAPFGPSKAKTFFSKFQSILMQVAKSGVINNKTAARKISKVSKKIK